ncbi:MAG TPA: hypothetical protein VIA62_19905 [Thermoanaerobaculia bacterium]|jgi:tetratricopeptide (TPR) repeat protein|nr:hypothetical protein [Thermoanaerobaculia bacterium]
MKNPLVTSALALLLTAPTLAQMGNLTESMGRYQSADEKAMIALSRGMRTKKKADEAKEPAVKAKLYEQAKKELSESLGHLQHYDGFLALGQVYLALGKRESALDACLHAQALRPNDEPAKSCIEEARKTPEKADAEAKAGGGR